MKFTKIAALAAVLVMGCTAFYGCGETGGDPGSTGSTGSSQTQQQAVTLTGTWKVDSITIDGKTQSLTDWAIAQLKTQLGDSYDFNSAEGKQAIEMLTTAFDSIAYEFKDDGTLSVSAAANGQTASIDGTYKQEGDTVTFTAQGQTGELKFDAKAGTLSVDQDGMTLVMKKA